MDWFDQLEAIGWFDECSAERDRLETASRKCRSTPTSAWAQWAVSVLRAGPHADGEEPVWIGSPWELLAAVELESNPWAPEQGSATHYEDLTHRLAAASEGLFRPESLGFTNAGEWMQVQLRHNGAAYRTRVARVWPPVLPSEDHAYDLSMADS